jgi:hypothetical protein
MKRIVTGALIAALAGISLRTTGAQAQTAPSVKPAAPAATDSSAQSRQPLRRIPIYREEHWEPDVIPRYNPGPNAVRNCSLAYVQENRPSGPVITPHISCVWRPG